MESAHFGRVARIARIVGQAAGFKPPALRMLQVCAGLHDLGKRAIPASILEKPGPLTREEWRIMRRHTRIGSDLMAGMGLPDKARLVALTHHERWDGTGYPFGLAGQEIPLCARLVSLADVYDALISARCYKPAYPESLALEIVRREKGRHFDPALVDLFLDNLPRIRRVQ